MKDMPAHGPEGLSVVATPPREDPADAVVTRLEMPLAQMPAGTRLGTGSLRRGALARRLNPGLEIVPIRGNVPTRIRKVDDDEVDAVLLAAAGLRRLGLADRIAEVLDVQHFVPAPAQGILALQTRTNDDATRTVVQALADPEATLAAAAERGFLRRLGANCTVPVGCFATRAGDRVHVHGLVVHPAGDPLYSAQREGPVAEAASLGRAVAEDVIAAGADAVLSLTSG